VRPAASREAGIAAETDESGTTVPACHQTRLAKERENNSKKN